MINSFYRLAQSLCCPIFTPKTKEYSAQEIMDILKKDIPFIRGITVSGGVALLGGLDLYLSSKLGLEIKIAENPLDCCIEGMGKVIEISPDLVSFN